MVILQNILPFLLVSFLVTLGRYDYCHRLSVSYVILGLLSSIIANVSGCYGATAGMLVIIFSLHVSSA